MSIQHYFAVEQPLIEKLQQLFPEVEIFTPSNIEDMLQTSNADVGIHVIYHDDRIADGVSSGTMNAVYQQWLVVLCIRDAQAQLEQTMTIRDKASPYILTLLKGLQGFNPKLLGFKQFKRANSPVRFDTTSSFAYYPFLFEIQMIV